MLTIALDTSGEMCAIALAEENRLLAEHHFYHHMDLLQRLVPAIKHIVSESGRDIGDIKTVVVALGPGSFTGLRIGMTVAKSLAWVNKAAIVGVPTLDAIAAACIPAPAEIVCPMIHARAGEVYWTAYNADSGQRLFEYCADEIEQVVEKLGTRKTLFCGSGARRNWDAISDRMSNSAILAEPWTDFARGAVPLKLGMESLSRGEQANVTTLTPMYIKKPTPVMKLESGELKAGETRK